MSKNKKSPPKKKEEIILNKIKVIKEHDGIAVDTIIECKNKALADKMIDLGFWKWI